MNIRLQQFGNPSSIRSSCPSIERSEYEACRTQRLARITAGLQVRPAKKMNTQQLEALDEKVTKWETKKRKSLLTLPNYIQDYNSWLTEIEKYYLNGLLTSEDLLDLDRRVKAKFPQAKFKDRW